MLFYDIYRSGIHIQVTKSCAHLCIPKTPEARYVRVIVERCDVVWRVYAHVDEWRVCAHVAAWRVCVNVRVDEWRGERARVVEWQAVYV